ncbi:MAG TPA: class I SAM-dependent methyltransferase [Jatrophihabitans sp.]|jgi:SAM-dependent methyltransferase|nr:class I SAM-dependent methyltransferase [Jatrophihabitans sp.]
MTAEHTAFRPVGDVGSSWPLVTVCGQTTATFEGPAWSAAAAGWFAYWARFAAPARVAVAQASGLGGGVSVLDVGCGSGEFCALAAGMGAKVSGLDAAAGLIAFARRATPDGDLRVGAMEQLPWADNTFDMVSGFNAFQFAADYVAALAEARRVTRRGGRIAICNWGRVDDREVQAVFEPLSRYRQDRPPDVPPYDPPPIGEPGVLESLAEGASLQPERAAEVDVPYAFADRATLERALLAFAPAYGISADVAEQVVRETVDGPADAFRRADGSYRFENRFRYLIAVVD